ncbi:MAG: hypothetical protein J6W46_00765, partial [Spirochaetaceae bacterium]|nr:hypothetical protein [Spirochaetaceae bacterium]
EKMEERRQMNERAQALRAEGGAKQGSRYNPSKSKAGGNYNTGRGNSPRKGGNNRKKYGKNRRG